MSITNFYEYCKSQMCKIGKYDRQSLVLFIVAAVLIVESFFVGILIDTYYNSNHSIVIEKGVFVARMNTENESQNKLKIVASKNGKRYYFLHCSGVKRIKEANKIYFKSENDAKKKGLTMAANCK